MLQAAVFEVLKHLCSCYGRKLMGLVRKAYCGREAATSFIAWKSFPITFAKTHCRLNACIEIGWSCWSVMRAAAADVGTYGLEELESDELRGGSIALQHWQTLKEVNICSCVHQNWNERDRWCVGWCLVGMQQVVDQGLLWGRIDRVGRLWYAWVGYIWNLVDFSLIHWVRIVL